MRLPTYPRVRITTKSWILSHENGSTDNMKVSKPLGPYSDVLSLLRTILGIDGTIVVSSCTCIGSLAATRWRWAGGTGSYIFKLPSNWTELLSSFQPLSLKQSAWLLTWKAWEGIPLGSGISAWVEGGVSLVSEEHLGGSAVPHCSFHFGITSCSLPVLA